MFTGLIDDVGTIEDVSATEVGRLLRVRCDYHDLVPGESIALNGACLTVRECGDHWFTVAAISATLSRTTIGRWQTGGRINLERAMRADSRFGGHIVQGHVDGIATVLESMRSDDTRYVKLALPADVAEVTVLHGSITVDGVSLTVNAVVDLGIEIALIEYTLRHTTLGDLVDGDTVHVESDVIGKYVRQLARPYGATSWQERPRAEKI